MIAAARVVAAAGLFIGALIGGAARGHAADVAPPALVLPGAVEPADGPRTSTPLAGLVEQFTPKHEHEPVAPPDAEAAALAMRKYVEGCSALADNRALVAVTTLKEALAADPSSRAIRTQLARAYARAGNAMAAADLFEEVVREAPDVPEALLTLGLQARKADDAEATVRYLGALVQLDPAVRSSFFAQLRPGWEARVDLALSQALRQINADLATIEVLTRTIARDDPDLLALGRFEARRALGDAQARHGDLAGALTTWTKSVAAADDIEAAVIEPRIAWALVVTHREGEAIGRLRSRLAGATPNEVDVAIASWLRSAVRDAGPLERWGAELAATHPTGAVARLAAALLARPSATPADASDRRALRDEFAGMIHGGDVASAAGRAAELIGRDPMASDRIVTALLCSGADARQLLGASQAMGPAGAALTARLFSAMNDFGSAWRAAKDGVAVRPDDAALVICAIDAAGRLGEPGFLEEISKRASGQDPLQLIALARAWRACGEPERGGALARRAAEIAAGATPPNRAVEAAALIGLAQAQAESAVSAADRRRALALDAVASARTAVTSDPANETAWRLFIGLLDAVGACDSPECEAFRKEAENARNTVLHSHPDSSFGRQLAIERRFVESSALDAIHGAIAFSAASPSDQELLEFAVTNLKRLGRPDTATVFLDERLALCPGDPVAWRLWTEAAIASGQPDRAIDRISARAAPPTSDPIAMPLKELALRETGRNTEADAAAAERIAALPSSPRRDLERAAQAISRGNTDDAVAALDNAAKALEQLPTRELLTGAEVAFRLRESAGADRARLVRLFSSRILDLSKRGDVDAALVARAAALVAIESSDSAEVARLIDLAIAATCGRVGAGEVPVWLAIGQSFADRGRTGEGAAFLAALLRSETRIDSAAAARIATACFALDAASDGSVDRSIAILDLERARGIRPFARDDRVEATDSDALLALSNLYSLIGNRSGSLAVLRESLKRDPEHAMSANNLAWDALERGEADAETIRLAELALSLQPSDKAILDSVGWLRYLQGRITGDGGAVDLLRRAVQAAGNDPDPDPLDHLGDALWRAGEHGVALALWRQARDIVERKFPKEQMVRTLQTYERREHGVSVADTDAFWQRTYGAALERTKKKIEQVERGEEPSIAPLASP